MNRLLSLGFEPVGSWQLDGADLRLTIERYRNSCNILYAFVCDGRVMYIGKTVRTLASRMQNYRTPGRAKSTNIRNKNLIMERLKNDEAVELYALPDNGLLTYGGFHLNLAAALEDDLIRQVNPPWNGGNAEAVLVLSDGEESYQDQIEEPSVVDAFTFVLGNTYFQHGFFNVPVAHQLHFAGHGQKIELFVVDTKEALICTINRTANTNKTPRILGGGALREAFQLHWNVASNIRVEVLSQTSFRLR